MGTTLCAESISRCQYPDRFSKGCFCLWILEVNVFEYLAKHHLCLSLPEYIALPACFQCLFYIGTCDLAIRIFKFHPCQVTCRGRNDIGPLLETVWSGIR